MMELWCEQKKCFVMLANTMFSIESNSQFTDLENYTCANSYDIEIVLNSDNTDIINNNYYCLLIRNGSPFLRGRLILQGTTPTTIKCVYQALPYGGVFNDFEFRDKLGDYFENYEGSSGEIVTPLSVFGNGLEYLKTDSKIWDLKAKNGAYVPINMLNYGCGTLHTWTNILDIKGGESIDVKPHQLDVPVTANGYAYINTSRFLRGLGIKVKLLNSSENGMLVYLRNNAHYLLKIEMNQYYTTDVAREWNEWHCDNNSKIYLQDNDSGVWDENLPTYDCSQFFMGSLRRGVNSSNPRDRESYLPFDMKITQIDWLFLYRQDSVLMPNKWKLVEENGKTYQQWTQEFEGGLKWDKGKNFYLNDSVYRDLDPMAKTSSVAYVYADCEFSVDIVEYAKSMALYSDIPLLMNQWSFLNETTNNFLNELSLNCDTYKTLRNPMFIGENYDVIHGLQSKVGKYFYLSDKYVGSVEKEVDSSAERLVRVGFNNENFSYSESKPLNKTRNDMKDVKHTFIGYTMQSCYSTDGIVPPYYVYTADDSVNSSRTNIEFKSKGINGVFCKANDDLLYPFTTTPLTYYDYWSARVVGTPKEYYKNLYQLKSDDSNWDYLKYYPNKNEKYKITCVGYSFQEFVRWDDRDFVVSKYSTSDFEQYELEMYPIG